MATNRVWVLGAADPEMLRIEALLRECGEEVAYAVTAGGERVSAGTAYRAVGHRYAVDCGATVDATEEWCLVECDVPTPAGAPRVVIDHHRPGDPGWGVPPAEFFRGSSLGQTIAMLSVRGALDHAASLMRLGPGWFGSRRAARSTAGNFVLDPLDGWVVQGEDTMGMIIPMDLVLAAAADHCLPAAYRGQCPGVDPDTLMRWRASSRAEFQRRSVEEVLRDVEAAMAAIQAAPEIELAAGAALPAMVGRVTARDLRGRHVPELPEAAARLGIGFVADGLPLPDGRTKIILQSASPEQLAAWPAWAERQGLVDLYGGDPERGFAGGYVPAGAANGG